MHSDPLNRLTEFEHGARGSIFFVTCALQGPSTAGPVAFLAGRTSVKAVTR